MTFPLAVILGYTAVLMALGLYLGRRVRAGADFFVAGRTLGPGLLFATLLASNIGAGSTVGATGLGYRDGLAAWWWVGAAALGSMIQALWIGPKIRDIAAEHNFQTVGDYLEFRYDRRVRSAVAAVLWVGSLAIFSGQIMGLALILGPVAAAPKWLACVIGGVLVTGYFAAGGLHGTVRVNVVQLAVKLFGLLLALFVGLALMGGLSSVTAAPSPSETYWNFWESGDSGWMYVALLTPAFIVSPGLLQKVYGARDSRAVRWGVGLNAVALFLYAGVPVLLGMIARARFPTLEGQELAQLALPMLLSAGLPPLVGAIGLAAVFSAEVSAADASLFMLTTSVGRDLYKRTIAPDASDRSVVVVTKLAAVVAGTIGTVLAILLPTVVAALSIFYALIGVSLFVPILAGLYIGGAGAMDALVSIIAGVGTVLLLHWVGGLGTLTSALFGLIAAGLAFVIVFAIRVRVASGERVRSA